MDRNRTFDLQDLDDAFWEKVVFFEIGHSSGMGGPGHIWFVTQDQKKYYLGFEDLPFSEFDLEKHFPLIRRTKRYEDNHFVYEVEDQGWKYVSRNNALVRGDIWTAFQEVLSDKELIKEKVVLGPYNLPDIVGLALGTDKLERLDYIRSVIYQEKWKQKMEAIEAEHERNKLTEEYFDWKPIYPNNIEGNGQEGWYALLLMEKEGKITGSKFSIVFQRKQVSPMCFARGKDEIELYNLFVKDYDEIVGPLQYPSCKASSNVGLEKIASDDRKWERKHRLSFFSWNTLTENDVNDYGYFMRSFQTLEEAKEYAMFYANANSRHHGNKNTILKDTGNVRRDHQRRVKRYDAYMAYRKYYKEILEAVCNFDDYPSECSGGGAFLFEAILEAVPEITKEQLEIIWEDIPLVLEKRTQRYIEEERRRSLQYIEIHGE